MSAYLKTIQKLRKNLRDLAVDNNWTLFLDRDGVLNKKLEGDYVKSWAQFEWLPNAQESIKKLSLIFGKIIILTNQQGIGKGLMSKSDLEKVHNKMLSEIEDTGGVLDGIYYCPHLVEDNCDCRKPKPGMAYQAKEDYPDIDYSRSVILGDSVSDIELGSLLGMVTVFIGAADPSVKADHTFADLNTFASQF